MNDLFTEVEGERAGRVVKFSFARLPRLTSNTRLVWQAQMRRKALIRKEGRRQGRACGVQLGRVRVRVIVHPKTYGHYDPTNWESTFKALLDGLVDVGVLPGDSVTYVPQVIFEGGSRAADGPRLDVILEEIR